ncbi:MAG: HU family DNA-binding protein [Candidatus Nanopelagicales bacterium]
MNRADLVSAVAERAGLTNADADAALKAFADVVGEATRRREKVSIIGFLTFDTTHRSARTGRNPQTGEEIQIAATWAPKVSAGAALKQAAAENN